MNNLAKLTAENHRNAERNRFAKYLVSGKITPEHYACYLYNVYVQYQTLEKIAEHLDLLDTHICDKVYKDFQEIKKQNRKYVIFPTTKKYIDYLEKIKDQKKKIMAHVYVRHMGDMFGGQIIAKQVPGDASMYDFQNKQEQIKQSIRNRCDDSMADEANVCFQMVTEFFKECANEFNLE